MVRVNTSAPALSGFIAPHAEHRSANLAFITAAPPLPHL
jgi:hypothetical protein